MMFWFTLKYICLAPFKIDVSLYLFYVTYCANILAAYAVSIFFPFSLDFYMIYDAFFSFEQPVTF